MPQGFYSAQEACAKLKKTEDELRKLVRDGQLREFRDAKGTMYRAQEIDALAGSGSDPGQDSVAELTLADSAAPVPPAKTEKPAEPKQPATPAGGDTSVFNLDPAAAEKDSAKTDVFSLEPGSEDKKSGSGSGSSISLLDDLENITIPADPMAETVVSASTDLEGGSGGAGGSGLLDLARESDDTSLGAELYDESAEGSGSAAAAPAADSSVSSASAIAEAPAAPAPRAEYYVVPSAAEATDPMAPAFVGMSIIGMIAILIGGMAVAAAVAGSWPSILNVLYTNLLFYLLGALVLAGAAGGIGWALGRQAESRRFAYSRAGAAAAQTPETEEEA